MIIVLAGATVFLYVFLNLIGKTIDFEAREITAMILDDHSSSFANNGMVDEAKLTQFEDMDYYELKKSLNAKNDFCIYIEDENGNTILAKGSSRLSQDGLYCRE